jgi:photosystem II stability/assembly factor-like uncharacterized protein
VDEVALASGVGWIAVKGVDIAAPHTRVAGPWRERAGLLLLVCGVLLLINTACASSALAGVAWTQITPGYGVYYQGVDFVDNQNGWLVGDKQTILRTHDGGATWASQHQVPGSYALSKVQMWSPTRGWAVGNGGALFATTDGSNWAQQAEPTGSYLGPMNDLCFVSSMEGWAVGSSSHIIHTTTAGADPDGGGPLEGWTMANTGVPEGVDAVDFNGVDFVDAMHGWAVGEDYYEGNYWASVYATSDGGAKWQINFPARPFAPGKFNDVEFFPPSGLWVCGEDTTAGYGQRGMIWYSNDGGLVWTRQTLPAGTDTLNAIHFDTAGHGWAVGGDVILVTTNGGGLWTRESVSSGSYLGILNDVDSVDGVLAWAAGYNDRVMKRGNTPTTADALPLPPSPVSNVLEPPFYVDLWSRYLDVRQQIIVTMIPPAGESFETCLWPPGTQEVADMSAAVAQSRTYDKIKRFKYIVPSGKGGTYYIQQWSSDSSVTNGGYSFQVNVQSPTTRVTPTAPAVAKHLRTGRKYTYFGTLSPLHFFGERSVKVVWQKYTGGRWRTALTMRPTNLDYRTFTRYQVGFSLTGWGHGTMRWRVQAIHLKDALHPQKASAWRYFSVTN